MGGDHCVCRNSEAQYPRHDVHKAPASPKPQKSTVTVVLTV